MKKVLIIVLALGLMIFGVSGFASADFCGQGCFEFWDTNTNSNWFNPGDTDAVWTFNFDLDTLTPSGTVITPEGYISKAEVNISFYDKAGVYSFNFLAYDETSGNPWMWAPDSVGTNQLGILGFLTGHILDVTIAFNGDGNFGVSEMVLHGCDPDLLDQVPEPGSLLLLGCGLIGLAVIRMRKRH